MSKKLGLFYVVFQNFQVYILWWQFINFRVTLPIPSHRVPLNVFFGFQKVVAEILEHDNFVGPHGHSWRSYYRTHNIMDYLQIEDIKVKLYGNKDIVVQTICDLLKQNISQLVHEHFFRVSISRFKTMLKKGIMKVLPKKIIWLGRTIPYLYLD